MRSMDSRSQIATVARHELRHALRSGTGIVSVVIMLTVFLSIGNLATLGVAFFGHQESAPRGLRRETPAEQIASYTHIAAGAAEQLGADPTHVTYLVDERPALVSALFVVFALLVPFLAVAGAFNQTASAIERKALRFQLLRAPRAALLLGRFVAAAIFTEALLLLACGILAVYIATNLSIYPARETLSYFAHVALALGLLALPYIALASWISAAVGRPGFTFLLGQVAVGGVPLVAWIAGRQLAPLSALAWLTPWPLRFDLVHPSLSVELVAGIGLLVYTALYLTAALFTFRARDL